MPSSIAVLKPKDVSPNSPYILQPRTAFVVGLESDEGVLILSQHAKQGVAEGRALVRNRGNPKKHRAVVYKVSR